MEKQTVREQVLDVGIVPVIRATSGKEAMLAAEAVSEGGISIVEITMTVPGAVEVIRELSKTTTGLLVGAGTVLDADSARKCADAGAQFLVTPALDVPTVEFAVQQKILIMAGALSPTEIVKAWKSGADFVKVFPCGQVGGAKYIKAIKGPLPQIPLVPTGGVNLNTAAEFIEAGAAALGVGSELVQSEALKQGNKQLIVENASTFLRIVKDARSRTGQS
jgi:2-dehydro-3-deoxyphosphogluconate aldolase/(4S)-4-hydroxy-2-oxoglutarate aldolase